MSDFVGLQDFPGYEIDRAGKVRSVSRITTRSNGRPYTCPAKVLRPADTGKQLQVVLYRDKQRHVRSVHSLVLETFVGPRPDGLKGLHWDDDHTNNAVSNLRWGTSSENALDSIRNGTHSCASRRKCKRGHPLGGANLAPWAKSDGHRACLSCNRAKALAGYYWRKDDEVFVQQLADEKYRELAA